MPSELCPSCGEPLVGDAAISATGVKIVLTCPCGYRARVETDNELQQQFNLIRECSSAGALEAIAR